MFRHLSGDEIISHDVIPLVFPAVPRTMEQNREFVWSYIVLSRTRSTVTFFFFNQKKTHLFTLDEIGDKAIIVHSSGHWNVCRHDHSSISKWECISLSDDQYTQFASILNHKYIAKSHSEGMPKRNRGKCKLRFLQRKKRSSIVVEYTVWSTRRIDYRSSFRVHVSVLIKWDRSVANDYR